MAFGYHGRYLRVDLSGRSVTVETADPELTRSFLGGSGVGVEIWLQEAPLQIPPLDPANPLVIWAGLLTGTPVLTASRASVVAKSPLTGILSESTVGGYFGAALKAQGYDGLVLLGRAAAPVCLWVDSAGGSLLEASDLWGLETYETADALDARLGSRSSGTDRYGSRLQVFGIGPAGENLVPIASIMAGGRRPRAAGRTGMGAVMGSKNLKAVVCPSVGPDRPAVKDLVRLQASARALLPTVTHYTGRLREFGTAGGIPSCEYAGDLPIKNWYLGSWTDGAARTSGQQMADTILAGRYACAACPIHCGRLVRLPRQGTTAGRDEIHGPEYETCAGFGAGCLNDDLETIALAHDLCNRLGLDVISSSSVVAFAMEAAEKGLIGRDLAPDGYPIRWGDPQAILGLLGDMAHRRGIGEILGKGVRQAAVMLDSRRPPGTPSAVEFAIHVKGLEIAYHDPRAFTGMAVGYATANRGGCHLETLSYMVEGGGTKTEAIGFEGTLEPHSADNKASLAIWLQNYLAVFNPLGLCKFLLRGQIGPAEVSEWVSAVAGWNVDGPGLLVIGERLFNRRRILGVRQGLSRVDDTLPPRLLSHDRSEGGAAGSLPHLGRMLSEYYRLRGWTEDGRPSPKKLRSLGL